jgi:predicted nucleic acid-binding protein
VGAGPSLAASSRSRTNSCYFQTPIALDTSFVVEALLTTQPLHHACSAFLKRIFDSGVVVVTSDLLAVELAESAFAITLKERWGGAPARTPHRRTLPPPRHTAAESHHMSYEALLSPVNHLPIPIRRVTADARVLMTDFGIASYDAVHAASAIAAGAEAIVTLDTGFALLPSAQLAIYTDRSRLASCRNKRPR